MNKWLRIGLILLFSVVFLVSGYQLLDYYVDSNKQNTQFDELASMVQQAKPRQTEPEITDPEAPPEPTQPQPLPEYAEVSALNPDMVGWLAIEGTRINYPVMHAPEQVDKYLHRDFYGKYSSHGCLYIREACSVDPPTENITVYGHNMKDGSMFADLLDYSSKSFWEDHRYITFDTLMERGIYEIFAVFRTTATVGQGFAYHRFVSGEDPGEFRQYVETCQKMSLYDTAVTPEYGTTLITLSTCEYTQENGRFVVVARRVN